MYISKSITFSVTAILFCLSTLLVNAQADWTRYENNPVLTPGGFRFVG